MNNLHNIIVTKDIYFIYIDKKVSKKMINKIDINGTTNNNIIIIFFFIFPPKLPALLYYYYATWVFIHNLTYRVSITKGILSIKSLAMIEYLSLAEYSAANP